MINQIIWLINNESSGFTNPLRFLCGFTFSYAFTTPCVLLKQEAATPRGPRWRWDAGYRVFQAVIFTRDFDGLRYMVISMELSWRKNGVMDL